MQVTNIRFKDGEPSHVSVEMTTAEAAVITQLVGRLVPSTGATSEVWDCLSGEFFNRFWEAGIDGVPNDLSRMVSRLKWQPDAES
jgi:hypothetical protein